MNIEEVKERWREASDDEVIQAATIDRNGYPPEIQAVIDQQVQQRDLHCAVELSKPSSEKSVGKKGKKTTIRRRLIEEAQGFLYFMTREVPRTLIWFFTTNLKMGIAALGVWLVTYPMIRVLERFLLGGARSEYVQMVQATRGLLMICAAILVFIKFCPYRREDKD